MPKYNECYFSNPSNTEVPDPDDVATSISIIYFISIIITIIIIIFIIIIIIIIIIRIIIIIIYSFLICCMMTNIDFGYLSQPVLVCLIE